jgi:HAE1 family hydrophobic/amphiphilic exporter-1
VSQVLTLYTTPVIYLYMDRLNNWIAKFGFSTPPAEPAAAPAPATS